MVGLALYPMLGMPDSAADATSRSTCGNEETVRVLALYEATPRADNLASCPGILLPVLPRDPGDGPDTVGRLRRHSSTTSPDGRLCLLPITPPQTIPARLLRCWIGKMARRFANTAHEGMRLGVARVFCSRRIEFLPGSAFASLDGEVAAMRAQGHSVVNLGRADPDHETPRSILDALHEVSGYPESHGYAPYAGTAELRRQVALWYADRFGVHLDPEREVLILLGSKDGLFHLPFAVLDPGEVALVPDPSFPAYRVGAYLAGAEVVSLRLYPETDYLPDLGAVDSGVLRKARLLYLNYPNNPTGAVAPLGFFREAVSFADRYGILLCNDLAYADSGYEGYHAPSLLQCEDAKDVAVEFTTWSKTFCMAGWRLGAVVGNAQAIHSLLRINVQVHSGVWSAIQHAGAVALRDVVGSGFIDEINAQYQKRRDVMVSALGSLGIDVIRPWATPYLWFRAPRGLTSVDAVAWLLREVGVALAPGSAFGPSGEGFLRMSLTATDDDIRTAARRLRNIGADGWRSTGRGVAPVMRQSVAREPSAEPERPDPFPSQWMRGGDDEPQLLSSL